MQSNIWIAQTDVMKILSTVYTIPLLFATWVNEYSLYSLTNCNQKLIKLKMYDR